MMVHDRMVCRNGQSYFRHGLVIAYSVILKSIHDDKSSVLYYYYYDYYYIITCNCYVITVYRFDYNLCILYNSCIQIMNEVATTARI